MASAEKALLFEKGAAAFVDAQVLKDMEQLAPKLLFKLTLCSYKE